MADTPSRGDCHVLSARVELVETLREDFGIFLRDLGVPDEGVGFWQLVLSEAVVNAMIHGCQGDYDKAVTVRWRCHEQEITLEVEDPGSGPTEAIMTRPDLPDDPYQPHGRGIYLIEKFADRLEHWKSPQGYLQRVMKSHPEIAVESGIDTVLEQALNELSVSYESMAAFYRLGDGLVRSESVSHFITQAVGDLRKVVADTEITFFYADHIEHALYEELSQIDDARSWAGLRGLQLQVANERLEQVWEDIEEVEQDPMVSAYACGVCCPVQAAGRMYGVISVVRKEQPYLNAGELNNVRTFADLFGIAVANADNTIVRAVEQRAYQELEIATEIQKTLLPLPEISSPPEWTVYTQRKSARDVAGDYIDVYPHKSGALNFAVIDVMGKGVSAAFLAAMFRTAYHMLLQMDYTLLGLAQSLNRVICGQIGDMTLFATCALARLDPKMETLEVINAGHCPVMLTSQGGGLRESHPSGPPFGLFTDATYATDRFTVEPGDKLFMVTDGLYEWETKEGIWGWDAFQGFIRGEADTPASDFWDRLQTKMKAECPDIENTRDDQTLLIWEYLKTPSS